MERYYIEIQAFGDFDVTYTERVMYIDKPFDADVLKKEFLDYINIQNTLECLQFELNGDFIAYLEMRGFKEVETQKMYFDSY